jgi:formylglycine-generating enzyme
LPTVNEWEYAAAASESKKNANREENFLRRILNWYGEPQGERLKDV